MSHTLFVFLILSVYVLGCVGASLIIGVREYKGVLKVFSDELKIVFWPLIAIWYIGCKIISFVSKSVEKFRAK